jgi:hypothetical protein
LFGRCLEASGSTVRAKECDDSETQGFRVVRRAAGEVQLRVSSDDGDVCLSHTGRLGECVADFSTFFVSSPGGRALKQLGHHLITLAGSCLTASSSGALSTKQCEIEPDALQLWLLEVFSDVE